MKMLTKSLIALSAGSLLAAGANAFDVTATVSSTISVTETVAFTLGTVYATSADVTNDTSETAGTMTITPAGVVSSVDGTAATGDGANAAGHVSKFVALGGQQAGTVSVSGAAAFGTVTVGSAATPVSLTHESGSPSIPDIVFTTLTTLPADGDPLALDASGAGDILVGGTFTAADSTSQYSDGIYTGTYDVTVSY